jgi:hypothetical protein
MLVLLELPEIQLVLLSPRAFRALAALDQRPEPVLPATRLRLVDQALPASPVALVHLEQGSLVEVPGIGLGGLAAARGLLVSVEA